MNVDLDVMTNLGLYIVTITVIIFCSKTLKLPSQVLVPPESECTWITEQVFCPSTASLKPWLSSTESRPHSLSLSMLDFGFIILESQLSCVNWNRQKWFQTSCVRSCVVIIHIFISIFLRACGCFWTAQRSAVNQTGVVITFFFSFVLSIISVPCVLLFLKQRKQQNFLHHRYFVVINQTVIIMIVINQEISNDVVVHSWHLWLN